MSIGLLTLALVLAILFFFVLGLPVAFTLSGVAMIFALFVWGPSAFSTVVHACWGSMMNFVIVAIPLFILLGNILQHSGVADLAYDMIHKWMGPVKGGLAMGTVLICTAIAAMVGVVGAGVVTMGVIALPAMMVRKYDRRLAMGSVMAGGALGALIPPSIPMILFAHITALSVGKMFAGGIIPGLILATLYITYIGVRCLRNPKMGPAVPPEERVNWREKFVALRGSILPVILIVGVLGSIFSGAATPTEAAAVGVGGALICAAVNRKLDWPMIRLACYDTIRLSGMVMWILVGAAVFTRFYMGMGAAGLVKEMVMASVLSPWAVLIMIQLSLMALGMIMDDYAVVLIAAPIYTPIIVALGFNPLWFGILFLVNLQIAYLTPPYGFALFYMKGVVSGQNIPMTEVWRAILPFIPLQIVGLALVMIFPQLALWLPGIILK